MCPVTTLASRASRTVPDQSGFVSCASSAPTPQTQAGLPLPDKPSIAALPFRHMSGDPEQEYFADGRVEEIITALSRIRWLFVIARNPSFAYKGQADVKRVGGAQSVHWRTEGPTTAS